MSSQSRNIWYYHPTNILSPPSSSTSSLKFIDKPFSLFRLCIHLWIMWLLEVFNDVQSATWRTGKCTSVWHMASQDTSPIAILLPA
jgi:hypothetical protein